jgi:NADP-dependent 3-hydroxy acid dehydrogenase YdfG
MPRYIPHPDRRAAVVTGASSGIGRAIACALGASGSPVVLGARRVDRCEVAAAEIRAAGGEAIALPLDLVDDASVEEFAAQAVDLLGPIDIVVSNAGEVRPATAVDADPASFLAQLQVNLLGPQRLVHHLVPAMVGRGHGDVVFVTSEVARYHRPNTAAYVTSKSGLEGFADVMRMELEGTGVRVGIVRPGPSSTEQGTTWTEDEVNTVVAAWDHWGLLRHSGALRPVDVAAAVSAVVSMPRGTNITLLEVQPEAPGPKDPS